MPTFSRQIVKLTATTSVQHTSAFHSQGRERTWLLTPRLGSGRSLPAGRTNHPSHTHGPAGDWHLMMACCRSLSNLNSLPQPKHCSRDINSCVWCVQVCA